MSEDDLEELARLDHSIFADLSYPFFVLRQLFDVHGERMLVLEAGGTLCGYAVVAAEGNGKRGWILGLGVHERFRGLGYGRILMRDALRRLSMAGTKEVRLTVDPYNAVALRLYLSLGFVTVCRRANYVGPGGDRLIMDLELNECPPGPAAPSA